MTERVRRPAPAFLSVALTAAIAIVAALPWAHTGRATRSAFALARTADEIGVLEGVVPRALFVGLAFLPAATAGAWLLAVLGRRRAVAGLGAMAGLLAVVGAVVVWRAPVEPAVGPPLALVLGAAAIIGAVATALSERNP